jgi:hypothetical protein
MLLIANTIIEVAWLSATCFLVYSGHWIWAIFTLIGAFCCGYTTRPKESKNADDH